MTKKDHSTTLDWHIHYLNSVTRAETILSKVADMVFTLWSFLLHMVVYPFLMALEGGDFHLFLDAISIEAVFVSLCVGINTKLSAKRDKVAQKQRDQMQYSIETLIEANTKLTEEIHKVTVNDRSRQKDTGIRPTSKRPGRKGSETPGSA